MTYFRLINHQIDRRPPLPESQVVALWIGKALQALIVVIAHIVALVLCVLVATTIVLLLVLLYVGPKNFPFPPPFGLDGSYSSSIPPADMWVSFETEVPGTGDSKSNGTSDGADVKVDDPKESTNLPVPPATVVVDSKRIEPATAVPQPQVVQSPASAVPLKVSNFQGQRQSLPNFLEETKACLPPRPEFMSSPAPELLPPKLALKPTGLAGNTRGIRFQFLPASTSSSSSSSTSHSNPGHILDTDIVLWASGTTSPLYKIRHSPMVHPSLRVHDKEDFVRDGHLRTLSNFQEDFPQGYFRVDLQLQVVRDGGSSSSSSASPLTSSYSSNTSWYPQTEAQTGIAILSTMEYCTLTDMFQILSPGMPKPACPDALYLWRRFDDFVKMPMSALVPVPKSRRGRKVKGPDPAPVQAREKEEQGNGDVWDSEVEVEGGLKPKKKCRRGARGGRRHRRQFQDIILRQANSEYALEQGSSNFEGNGDPDFLATIRIPIAQEDDDRDRKFTLEISLGGNSNDLGCEYEHGNGEGGDGGWGENGVIDGAMLEAEWMQECVYAAWLIFVGLVKVDSAELDPGLGQ